MTQHSSDSLVFSLFWPRYHGPQLDPSNDWGGGKWADCFKPWPTNLSYMESSHPPGVSKMKKTGCKGPASPIIFIMAIVTVKITFDGMTQNVHHLITSKVRNHLESHRQFFFVRELCRIIETYDSCITYSESANTMQSS